MNFPMGVIHDNPERLTPSAMEAADTPIDLPTPVSLSMPTIPTAELIDSI
jgi:hypothetical protein